jgi:hypothetical protein
MESGSAGEEQAARRCLEEKVAGLTGSALERRHEGLMEWSEADLGLDREYAEQVYALAEEENLLPVYGLILVSCGMGVRELEEPEEDEEAAQQAPPDWLGTESVELDDVELERRLRATFRRFRSHLEASPDRAAAVQAFLAETDVARVRLR